jgi:hypothetical protein
MSNESENERIDLTQFDWMEHHSIKHMEDTGGLAIVDVSAIQMIPDLIEELKKCYDLLDDVIKFVEQMRSIEGYDAGYNDIIYTLMGNDYDE